MKDDLVAHTGYMNGGVKTIMFVESPDAKRKAAFEQAERMNKKNQMELPGDEWLIKEGWVK